ncbi:hypothetical protein Ciccas_002051 [Cichlidogyrus casuarinus]|uniref:Protein kinase domain-containing protein n=1 Tax=Cichlidogyrus casuarinus TaxID=1844966 RepID=A0ABD2QIE4_9PLAT
MAAIPRTRPRLHLPYCLVIFPNLPLQCKQNPFYFDLSSYQRSPRAMAIDPFTVDLNQLIALIASGKLSPQSRSHAQSIVARLAGLSLKQSSPGSPKRRGKKKTSADLDDLRLDIDGQEYVVVSKDNETQEPASDDEEDEEEEEETGISSPLPPPDDAVPEGLDISNWQKEASTAAYGCVESYHKLDILGEGSYATVYRGYSQ